MTDSLRDQLLGLGFKPAPKPERKPEPRPGHKTDRVTDPGKQRRPETRRDAQTEQHQRPARAPEARGNGDRPGARDRGNRPASPASQPRKPKPARSREEMDLAKAYAIRAQKEKEERVEAERVKQEEARLRREAKAKLETLLKDNSLNHPDADIARHFPYGGKIKRVHVTAEQLKALNAGLLGVVQQNGRYLLVEAALLAEAETVFPPCVALKVDPDAPATDDAYADPRYQVPDDLVW